MQPPQLVCCGNTATGSQGKEQQANQQHPRPEMGAPKGQIADGQLRAQANQPAPTEQREAGFERIGADAPQGQQRCQGAQPSGPEDWVEP